MFVDSENSMPEGLRALWLVGVTCIDLSSVLVLYASVCICMYLTLHEFTSVVN